MSNVNWNGNSSNLAKDVGDYLSSTNNKWDQAAATMGNQMGKAEDILLKSFAASSGDDKAVKDLAKALGMLDKDGNPKTDLAGLQAMAKHKYEQVQRAFAMFQQILTNAHQVLMQLIQSIRAR